MTDVKVEELNPPLDTQLGSWLYHTQLCPRMICPFVLARATTWSALVKVKLPREGSVESCSYREVLFESEKMQRTYPFHAVERGEGAEHACLV